MNSLKNIKLPLLLLSVLLSTSLLCCKKTAVIQLPPTSIDIVYNNFTEAKLQANNQNKNILLMIYADWCLICNDFKNKTLTDQSLADAADGKIIFALNNGEKFEGPTLFTNYGADGYPTYIITDANGTKLDKRSGAMTTQQFETWISAYYK
jgi:thiol:disulfide interchange protein